jgi:hypothetical protein
VLGGGSGVPFDEAAHSVTAEGAPAWTREQRIVGPTCVFGEKLAQHADGAASERGGTFLPALAAATHVRPGAEVHVSPAQAGELGDP